MPSMKTATPLIQATAEQSRFHTETLDTSREIDLKGVTISIGERELLTGSHLKLKEGVKYALIGRNGTGKSTLCTAISEKLIPGLGPSMKILLLSQVDESARSLQVQESGAEARTVLEHVLSGDKERMKAVLELEALTTAVDSILPQVTQKVVYEIASARCRHQLSEAQKIASRRSGARGKEARAQEIKEEDKVKIAEERLNSIGVEDPPANIVEVALEMLNDTQTTLDLLENSTSESRAITILLGLGFSQVMIEGPFTSLSGGWRSRCSLAVSLLVMGDLLILDEPTNFLDLEATIWLEQHLSTESRTLIIVSHDQAFLDSIVEETISIKAKTLRYFEGNPSAMEVNERKERRRLMSSKQAMEKKKEHIEKSIQQGAASAKKTGDENRQRMVKSRQKKLDDRFGIETSAKGGRFKLNRDLAGFHNSSRAGIVIEANEAKIKINIASPDKLRTLGDLLYFDRVEFRFAKAKTSLLEDVTFTVEQGDRLAFVGANGQGKSTLAKLILGTKGYLPFKGSITRHPLLTIGYFSQHSVEELSLPPSLSSLSLTSTPVTALSYFLDHFDKKGEKLVEQDVRACLGSFGLQGKVASETPLIQLSGGQKVRLAFALIVFKPPALLLLDELTTHVDAPTIQALALALRCFKGAIICITHDRYFSRVVVEGESSKPSNEDGDVSDSGDSSEEEDGGKKGRTYKVGAGKVKLLPGGMAEYVGFVERKLERRRKAVV